MFSQGTFGPRAPDRPSGALARSSDINPVSNKRKLKPDAQPLRKRALAHLPRHELFVFLLDRKGGKATAAQELAAAFGMSIRLVEYHLKVLQDANLVANVADEPGSEPTRGYVATATLQRGRRSG